MLHALELLGNARRGDRGGAAQAGAAQALRVNGEFAPAVAQIEEGTTRAAVRSEALQAARKFIGGETHL